MTGQVVPPAATGGARGDHAATEEGTAARLHSAAIHLLRRARADDPLLGLSPSRLSALSVLVFGGQRTLGELAAAEQVKPPTMTRLVAALERAGLVAKAPSSRDGRSVIVRATPRAVRALEGARLRRVQRVQELLGGLSEEEWRAVEEAVGLLERALR